MKPIKDITGQKPHHLLVKQMMGVDAKHHTLCLCLCDCGRETIQKAAEVLSGHVKQCEKCRQTHRKPDLIGRVFGYLAALKEGPKDKRNNRTYECLCFNPKPEPEFGPCGKTKIVAATQLVHGLVESCGCLLQSKRKENIVKAQVGCVTHGMSRTLTHNSWNSMMQRCYNYKCQAFSEYGAVGIVVCQSLRESPVNLKMLIGERPEGDYSLDRWPVPEGFYTCGNCPECKERGWKLNLRWATKKEQAENRGNAVMVEIDGVIKPRTQAAKELGMTTQQAIYHLKDKEVKTMKRVEFQPPQNVVPEGTKDGEEFDLVCTFRVKGQNVCLVQLGDEKMPGYSDKDKPAGKASYADEHAAMTASGGGNGNGDAGIETQGAY